MERAIPFSERHNRDNLLATDDARKTKVQVEAATLEKLDTNYRARLADLNHEFRDLAVRNLTDAMRAEIEMLEDGLEEEE